MVDSSIAINEVDAEAWLRKLTGTTPQTSVGWFRAGVGFYRKKYHNPAVTCLEKAVNMDPINYEAWQVLARAYILQNRRKDAIEALKKSVKLNNAADWQMLVELTNLEDEQN
jgi:tetratricopeptide (TPR) repeat protein